MPDSLGPMPEAKAEGTPLMVGGVLQGVVRGASVGYSIPNSAFIWSM